MGQHIMVRGGMGCSRAWTEVDGVHILLLTGWSGPITFVPKIHVTCRPYAAYVVLILGDYSLT